MVFPASAHDDTSKSLWVLYFGKREFRFTCNRNLFDVHIQNFRASQMGRDAHTSTTDTIRLFRLTPAKKKCFGTICPALRIFHFIRVTANSVAHIHIFGNDITCIIALLGATRLQADLEIYVFLLQLLWRGKKTLEFIECEFVVANLSNACQHPEEFLKCPGPHMMNVRVKREQRCLMPSLCLL